MRRLLLFLARSAILTLGPRSTSVSFMLNVIRYLLNDVKIFQGCQVFALCLSNSEGAKKLNESRSGKLHVIFCDVTKDDQIANARKSVEKILDGQGMTGFGKML